MDERRDPVTRLGPDSGGRAPDIGGPLPKDGEVRVHTWEWGTGRWDAGRDRRPPLPWIGIFLLVFGALLLLRQLYPQAQSIGSLIMLAVGIAFLIRWAISRGTGSLYAGALITALAVPSALTDVGVDREGLGTLSLGVAFLSIALVRLTGGGGIGWQAWIGGLLAIIGGVSVIQPQIGGLIVPLALVAVGAVLLLGGGLPGRRR